MIKAGALYLNPSTELRAHSVVLRPEDFLEDAKWHFLFDISVSFSRQVA